MYTLLWFWPELPSHLFSHHDGNIYHSHELITHRAAPAFDKKNHVTRLSLSYFRFSLISTWSPHSTLLCQCLYILSLRSTFCINMIFALVYNFFTRTDIDENRRCIDYYHADYSYTKIRRKFCALHHLICDRKRRLNQLCVRLLRKK